MAKQEHIDVIKQGAKIWNKWRDQFIAKIIGVSDHSLKVVEPVSRMEQIDLSDADLSRIDLSGTDHTLSRVVIDTDRRGANYRKSSIKRDVDDGWIETYVEGVNLSYVNLQHSRLVKANLIRASLEGAELTWAHLDEANLSGASLSFANLRETKLNNAILCGANLHCAELIYTNLKNADLTGCLIYGTSVWDIELEGAKQSNLIITQYHPPLWLEDNMEVIKRLTNRNQSTVTVDNLEVAQFIYLLLNNERIRDVIDTITSKVVLILSTITQLLRHETQSPTGFFLDSGCIDRKNPERQQAKLACTQRAHNGSLLVGNVARAFQSD